MKKLKLIGSDGVELGIFLIDVKGDNFRWDIDPPIFYPVVSISLVEEKGENPLGHLAKENSYVKLPPNYHIYLDSDGKWKLKEWVIGK